jgi:hypothetical protein
MSPNMSAPNGFRGSHNPKVAGSNPAPYSILEDRCFAWKALADVIDILLSPNYCSATFR